MKKTIWLLVAVVTVMLFSQCQSGSPEGKAKYVFYFIGDGMGVNQVNGTEMYRAECQGRIGIEPLGMTRFPVVNFATTYSKSNSVTCSAAAGTALATGTKTKNGTIAMDSLHEQPLYSIATRAKKAGRRVGITTSVSVDHATPAVFYAHQPDRNMYYEIGTDLPKAGFDFYAGSGFREPVSPRDSSAVGLFDLFASEGYAVVRGLDEYMDNGRAAEKLIMIQPEGKPSDALPYAVDRDKDDMTLAQITETAIDYLGREGGNGFFLMVEGGKIDWACHSNDAGTVFREVEDMNGAVEKALEFYRQHPKETLIVITADHETGGIVLGTGRYALNLQALKYQKMSKENLSAKIQRLREESGNKVSWEDVKALLSSGLGLWSEVPVNEEQEASLKAAYQRTFKAGAATEKSLYAETEQLAGEAVRVLDAIAMVGWTSGSHSAGVVPVFAIGAGAELFEGKLDNTDIPERIGRAAGY